MALNEKQLRHMLQCLANVRYSASLFESEHGELFSVQVMLEDELNGMIRPEEIKPIDYTGLGLPGVAR
jgi:hypothetical protein